MTESTSLTEALDAATRRRKDDGNAAMNAAIRGRGRVDAADHTPEPPVVAPHDYDLGVRGSPAALPPPDMSAQLRADLAARRRRREDYA
jgi:hypothetical protein